MNSLLLDKNAGTANYIPPEGIDPLTGGINPIIKSLFDSFEESFNWGERIQKTLDENPEAKTAFQNDLNALQNRWGFSLFLEGAQNSENGLGLPIFQMVASAVTGIGLGILCLPHEGSHPGNIKKAPAPLLGVISIGAGVTIPYKIYAHHRNAAVKAQIKSIVQKNLSELISPNDCKKLVKNIILQKERGIPLRVL